MVLLPFNNPLALDVSVSGGKGASLARLTSSGFNVPPGIIISAEAYREFIGQSSWFMSAAPGVHVGHPGLLADESRQLRRCLEALALPERLATELDTAIAKLVAEHGIRNNFSVRSSATAEDGANAAFAGQHDTFLNTPREQLAEKIKACWISLWSERAIAYRHQVGLELLDADMAVVVQQMVEADVAGVVFTVDSVSGNLEHTVVNASYGLGETVVSGDCADHWVLDKSSGLPLEAHLAEKTLKLVSNPQGGTTEVHLEGEARTAPCLSDEELRELAGLGVHIQKAYGFPQDIEFARANGKLFVLQSRPITSIPARWTRDESAERFPNAVSPLAWELVEEGFHSSLNYSFELMGLPSFKGKWFAMFEGYVYGDQNAVELYANGVPLSLNSLEDLKRALPVIREKYGWVQELPTRWARDLDWYLLKLGEFKGMDLSRLSLKELWAHVREISATGAQYFLPNIAISITQRVLYKVLHGLLAFSVGADRAQGLFDALLAHCDTKTGVINAELYKLAKSVQAYPAVFEFPNAELLDDGVNALKHTFPGFWADFSKLLAEHGHREIEFDPYVATWVESPEVVLDTLRVMAQGELNDPHANVRALKIRAQETLFELQKQVPDEFRYFFTEVVRLAQAYTSLDDLEHYQTTRLTLPMRRAVRELGVRLVDLGIVNDPMDVFFANSAVLEEAICAPHWERWVSLSRNIETNRNEYFAARNRTPRWTLAEQEEQQVDVLNGLKGIAGSPGKAIGPVFVIHGPEDFGKFPKGAVLVARTTNPAWTPLFYGACAVVTESGGPLSHGAVTAREMQKPAVMAVRGILTAFENGQLVEVDGSRGIVTPVAEAA
jgi:phosphohistidine swiveling domain-containing protein